jgi:N-acyl-D-amino-acid deacylase
MFSLNDRHEILSSFFVLRPFCFQLLFILPVIGWAQTVDVLLRDALIYDGTGSPPFRGDVAIAKDTIYAIGKLGNVKGLVERNLNGLSVAPGFINMLSWADGSLLKDGRSMSDITQGVTLEVFGEGLSPGPRKRKPNDKLWTTLGGYFDHLMKKGVSPNVASLVGATTVRTYVLNQESRAPDEEEMKQMQALVSQAMEEGALGVGSSLIYAPAAFATTAELIALCKVAASYSGIYMTHMRSESDDILQALNETFTIAHQADIPTSIYHLKINHARNWQKVDTVLYKIDSARRVGLKISANMYPYTASATGLKERVPTWAHEGGLIAMRNRFKNPDTREKILSDMAKGIPTRNSDPKNVMLLGFRRDSLNLLYKGKRLDEVAMLHGKNADETVLDLLLADRSSIAAVYFLISEHNVARMLEQPYISLGSDGGSLAAEPPFIDQGTHPRAYGTFIRFLSHYVRDGQLMPMEEGIRRITSLAAAQLNIDKRGILRRGYFADVVVFDPQKLRDNATFENPHRYSEGVLHVFVNGVQVLDDGKHTGALPGRVVRGKGYREERIKK